MPTWKQQDLSIHYETYGFEQAEAPAIVCLNGMTQTTLNWKSQARALANVARVITYDARGQGKSDLGETLPLTLKLHADDLAGLLDHLEVPRAHVVGFSHGARVALGFGVHHPERVDKMVFCSATAKPTALANVIIEGWRQIMELGGLEAMSWASLPSILGPTFLAQNEALIPGIIRASVQRNSPQGVRALLEGMIQYPDLGALAQQIAAPSCVVYGQLDPLVDSEGAKALSELLDAPLHEVPAVGHTVPIEAPEAFREIILPFLELS